MAKNKKSSVITTTHQVSTFETKLTRSEMIDFLVYELQQEVIKELEQVNADLAVLKFPKEVFHSLIVPDEMTAMNVWDDYKGGARLSFDVSISKDQIPPEYTEYLKKKKELEGQRKDLNLKLDQLYHNKGIVKNEIIKRTLEGSEEGRAALQNLQDLKLALKVKLLPEK